MRSSTSSKTKALPEPTLVAGWAWIIKKVNSDKRVKRKRITAEFASKLGKFYPFKGPLSLIRGYSF